jgi:hypothetical protein
MLLENIITLIQKEGGFQGCIYGDRLMAGDGMVWVFWDGDGLSLSVWDSMSKSENVVQEVESVGSLYDFEEVLGEGTFACVWKAV